MKKISEKIGERLQISHITGLAGILHDLGKYSNAFQDYIQKVKTESNDRPKRGSVDHASAGALLLFERYYDQSSPVQVSKVLIESVSNTIFSHHNELKDMLQRSEYSPFWKRKNKLKDEIDYERAKERYFAEVMTLEELDNYVEKAEQEYQELVKKANEIEVHYQSHNRKYWLQTMLTKYTFSVLLEADRSNSRIFDNDEKYTETETQATFLKQSSQLEKHLLTFERDTKINQVRAAMSENCRDFASRPPGVYTLSMPTGAGKTLSGMRFALHHATKYDKDRVFYFAPFTTIIEQNVIAVEKAIGEKQILEHHSNVVQDQITKGSQGEQDDSKEIKLLKETWEAPIIFSTMVQFLNVFYSGRKKDARRLHTLANSIIIFDEVQAVPIKCISLFNEALNFLAYYMNATIILCTATQPALQYVKNNLLAVDDEIIENLPMINEAFKRTNISSLVRPGGWNTDELEQLIRQKLENLESILIVLNTKKAVRDLYDKLNELSEYSVTHLSTAMCAENRVDLLAHLFETPKKKICISTQLIEAGVDVSFECVIRSLAGLDSIAQAAGRCNRHGEHPMREVYIINHREEHLKYLKTIEKGAELMGTTVLPYFERKPALLGGDLLSSKALEVYFKNYYNEMKLYLDFPIDGTSINNILFTENTFYVNSYDGEIPFEMRASFATAGKHFQVIDSNTTAILVPYGKGADLISNLESGTFIKDLGMFLREAQRYIVNVYAQDLNMLIQNQLVRVVEFKNMKLYMATENAYSKDYGMDYAGDAELSYLNI